MFAKNLLQKATHHFQHQEHQKSVKSEDIDIQIITHYGIPSTASVLAFDPIQRLLAIGTLDGRIKVIGGDNIEGLLISPKQLPYKYLEFLQNQGYLVSISNENDIQVWDLESRCITCCLQWESNITAFSVVNTSHFMYIGDEYGLMSVLKYEAEGSKLLQLPYHITANSLCEAVGFPSHNHQPIVEVLPQPCSSGNRVLIAYQNGLVFLWDILKAQVVAVKGDKDLQLKNGDLDSSEVDVDLQYLEEKEISALCWASSDGSILAVGYIDGDILFWNTSSAALLNGQKAGISDNNVVKLQLSSAERRLPVIVLHWSTGNRSSNNVDGQLFIYGGDEIGSAEVLTVLKLEWSSGMESVSCISRMNLTLTGSFTDMILLPTVGVTENNQKFDLFVLTSPGQLHIYDDASLSSVISQQDKTHAINSIEFPAVIPTADPNMTVSKLSLLGERSSKSLAEITSVKKDGLRLVQSGNTKWPLTGGVPSQLSLDKTKGIEKVYIVGYQDGSVRIWDATHPVFYIICVLESEIQGFKVAGSTLTVTKLDFCSVALKLAVGNECGLIRVYDLNGSSHDGKFHFVTESKNEVHILPQKGRGPQIIAAFCLLNSPIETLNFSKDGAHLAVGFRCGRVAVLDINSLSVRFLTENLSDPQCPVISVIWNTCKNNHGLLESVSRNPDSLAENLMLILTKDANFNIIDGDTGKIMGSRMMRLKKNSVVNAVYIIERSILVSGNSIEQQSSKDVNSMNESSSEMESGESLSDSLLLICCEDTLRLYSTKSVFQGNNKAIHKLKLEKPCCWSTIFRKDEVCGLVLLYQTGGIEIRSLPDLEVVRESSLMSIIKWNFRANMDKALSSSDNGQITLANGSELAFISVLAGVSDSRTPESLPCLHDKVLAAAADAAINFSTNQKKKQKTPSGILSGISKGLKGEKGVHSLDSSEPSSSNYIHLEPIFSRSLFADDPSSSITEEKVVELNIDDIVIDEPVSMESTSHKVKYDKKEKGTEREKLFEGATSDAEPRVRTKEEIIAKYRKTGAGDASSAAAQARNKLVERQEKLERMSKNTEQLQNGAEDFAALANELAKTMERRKWWNI